MPPRREPTRRAEPSKEPKAPQSTTRWFVGSLLGILRRHGSTIAFWVGMGYIVRQLSLALIAYAGQESNAQLALSVVGNVSFVFTASLALSGLSVSLYLRESTASQYS
jgi:hypothetical protein